MKKSYKGRGVIADMKKRLDKRVVRGVPILAGVSLKFEQHDSDSPLTSCLFSKCYRWRDAAGARAGEA